MQEMILVNPDAFTKYSGSMYSSSPTTGDWETYIAEDLVSYVDRHYRTIANRMSRGLGGHSMGGYGTIRIGMIMGEVGTQDGLAAANRQMERILTDFGITHTFETYDGDHTNRVVERIDQKVLPFFSKNLKR